MVLTAGKRLAGFLCVPMCALALPFFVHAAELQFDPATGSHAVDEEFAVKIIISPGTDTVNAADGTIFFDKDALSVAGISKDGSSFSLWTAEPSFSNGDGTIVFSGGTPTAFSKDGTVLTVRFKGKKVGTGAVTFTKGSILAADGKGTDVYKKGADASFTITEAAESEEPAEEDGDDEIANEGKPITPLITSSTHAKEDLWYATSTVKISWKVTPDLTGLRTGIAPAEDGTPTKTRGASVVTEEFTDLEDGIWYVFVQFKNEFGWGDVAKKKIQIDTAPPKDFDVALIEGDEPMFSFQTDDELSGMAKYDILFGETVAAQIQPADLVNGQTPVPPQPGGPTKVTVKAYDKAGNIKAVTKEFTLPEIVKNAKGQEEEDTGPFWTFEKILAILLSIVTGAVVSLNFYTKKLAREEKSGLLREVSRIRDTNNKIFSAMREEFEDQLNALDEKPQLTSAERDFMEKMKEAIEISEELMDTQMDELKKKIHG